MRGQELSEKGAFFKGRLRSEQIREKGMFLAGFGNKGTFSVILLLSLGHFGIFLE